jgi:hypothetical protein
MRPVEINRDHWDGMTADWVAPGERLWALETQEWGIWSTPDAEATGLPATVTGMKVEIDPGGVEFNLPTGGWAALFRRIGFGIEDYRELYTRACHEFAHSAATAEWGQDYPSEQVWWLWKL